MNPNARILVIRGGAIGDFILTLPVLAALRKMHPNSRLEILGYPRIASLAVAGGLADAVNELESPKLVGFFTEEGDLDAEFADYFARFDLIISFALDRDGVLRRNIGRCSAARFLQGRHRPDENQSKHASDVFLEVLTPFEGVDPMPRLHLPKSITRRTGSWLAVHPGSGSEKKNWPENRWIELLMKLASTTGLRFLLIGGEAEGGRLQRLAGVLPKGRVEIADHLPLPELAAQMAGCHFFMGHDSGIMHLAAALGMMGLILWGPTNPAIWRPRSEFMRLIHAPDGLENLQVRAVEESLHLLAGGFENLTLARG